MAKKDNWYELDNAAKIIPSTARGSDTRVFRLCCELKEEVDKETLQHALDQTIKEYPQFQCILKKGVFWYYLESKNIHAEVMEENIPPCTALYRPGYKNLLFRVLYYRNRISLEIYHALADGMGGFYMMKDLVRRYLVERYHLSDSVLESSSSSADEKNRDAFDYFYRTFKERKNVVKMLFPDKAYHCKGQVNDNLDVYLIEGVVSTKKMLAIAHEMNCTLSVLSVSLYIEAIIKEMPHRKHNMPIVIIVPVNLRSYFPSETTRNFWGSISVKYIPSMYDGTFDSIKNEVAASFERQLSHDEIFKTMNAYSALEHNYAVKAVPLLFKDLGIQGLYYLERRGITSNISNLGRIDMPEPLKQYIDHFSVYMSAQDVQMCISSFEDKMAFGFSTSFVSHDLPMRFFRKLIEWGVDVEIASSDFNREEGE